MDALTRLLDDHGPALRLYARQWLADVSAADDAVQEALVSCWRTDPGLTTMAVPGVFVAVRNAAMNLSRGERRRATREDLAASREHSSFVCPLADGELRGLIDQALDRLPIEQREAVTLHLWAGLTFAQVGEIIGCSINTAASRYRYALIALRDLLPSHEVLQ